MFKVDGNTSIRVTDGEAAYAVWRVVDDRGNLVTACYGPNSLAGAQCICDAMNAKGDYLQADMSKVIEQ